MRTGAYVCYFIDVEGILFEVGKGSINRARGGAMYMHGVYYECIGL